MQKVLALTLLLLAVAFGQSRTTINYVNASTITGTILNVLNNQDALAPVIYALWVPENSGEFQLTLTNTNSETCYYIYYYLISDVLPCEEDTFGLGDADRSFCNFYIYDYSSGSDEEYDVQPGYSSSYFKYQTGKYIYIGIATESAYTGSACTYTLDLAFEGTCAAGQVASYTGDSLPTCQSVTAVADISNYTISATGVNTTDWSRLWSFDVPDNTAYVSFTVASTEYFYIYGSSNNANAGYSSSYYDCSATSSSSNSVYYTNFFCYTPESGKFYTYMTLYSSPDNETFNYNFTSSIKVCPANMLGENCEWPAQAINITSLTADFNVVIPYNSSNYNMAYLYFDTASVPASTGNIQLNFYLNNVTNTETVYVTVTKDAIPNDNYRYSTQNQYITRADSDYWVFSWQDWAVDSRVFIGVECYNANTGGQCNLTVSSNSSSVTTTGSVSTTGPVSTTGTGPVSTTGTTGVSTTGVPTTTGVPSTTGTTGVTGVTGTTSGNVSITTSSASAMIATLALVLVALLF